MGCLSLLWMYTSLITFFALFLCTNTSLIFLTATNSPVLLSLARQTTLKEPFPMDRRSSYRSPTCDQPTEIGNTMSAGGIGFFSFAGDGSRGRRGMIKTYFPHITLHDEGTVSLVRELLDAASVGGHRHGSHAAAHHLGFPPPLDLQTAPCRWRRHLHLDPSTVALALLLASSQKVSERKIFSIEISIWKCLRKPTDLKSSPEKRGVGIVEVRMATELYQLSAKTVSKVILHATKYAHGEVCGCLLGRQEEHTVIVEDCIPFFHKAENKHSPLLEVALAQVRHNIMT